MTLYGIMARALYQSGEDSDMIDELRVPLQDSINQAYADLDACFRPLREAVATPNPLGEVALAGLPGGGIAVRELWDGATRRNLLFELNEAGDAVVLKAPHSGSVGLRYRVYPPRLSSNSDVPDLPESHHAALADFATYCLLGAGGISRQRQAQHFEGRYLHARSQLKAMASGRTRIAHKF